MYAYRIWWRLIFDLIICLGNFKIDIGDLKESRKKVGIVDWSVSDDCISILMQSSLSYHLTYFWSSISIFSFLVHPYFWICSLIIYLITLANKALLSYSHKFVVELYAYDTIITTILYEHLHFNFPLTLWRISRCVVIVIVHSVDIKNKDFGCTKLFWGFPYQHLKFDLIPHSNLKSSYLHIPILNYKSWGKPLSR